jgi:hypothetical protein
MSNAGWKWGPPRLIDRAQLRGYLQVEEAELAIRLERGQVPGPLWGCDAALSNARWDRHAVDRAMDRASAIPCPITAGEEELDRAFGFGQPAAARQTGQRPMVLGSARQAARKS